MKWRVWVYVESIGGWRLGSVRPFETRAEADAVAATLVDAAVYPGHEQPALIDAASLQCLRQQERES